MFKNYNFYKNFGVYVLIISSLIFTQISWAYSKNLYYDIYLRLSFALILGVLLSFFVSRILNKIKTNYKILNLVLCFSLILFVPPYNKSNLFSTIIFINTLILIFLFLDLKDFKITFIYNFVFLSLPIFISFFYYHDFIINKLNRLFIPFSYSMFLFVASCSLKNKYLSFTLKAFFSLLLLSFEILEFISYYLQASSFNLVFMSHFNLKTLNIPTYIFIPFLSLILFYLVFLFLLFKNKFIHKYSFKLFFYCIISLFLTILLTDNAIKNFIVNYNALNKKTNYSLLLDKYNFFTTKTYSDIHFINNSKKNLLLIYLESLEGTYLNEKEFPDLLPNIKNLLKEGIYFSNINQVEGANWTAAGIFASQCAMPLLSAYKLQDRDLLLMNKNFDKLLCLSNILNSLDYNQSYLGGAIKEFAGKGDLLSSHLYDEVLGYDELKNSNITKKNVWGLYDDDLYNLVFDKYIELAKKEKAFNLTMLTVDTHYPAGYDNPACQSVYKEGKNPILNAVHCADYMLNDFINKIKKTSYYKDTIIFMFSDHLALRNTAFLKLNKLDRKLFAFAINHQDKDLLIDSYGTHFDIAPTILDLLEIEPTKRIFYLGESLLKETNISRLDILKENTANISLAYELDKLNKNINSFEKDILIKTYEDKVYVSVNNNDFFVNSVNKIKNSQEAIISYFDKDRNYKLTRLIRYNELKNYIKNEKENYYLIVGLSNTYKNLINKKTDKTWFYLFGNVNNNKYYSSSSNSLEEIKIPKEIINNIVNN